MNKSKHIALIGCGNWGQHILRDLKKLDCQVSVVVRQEKNREKILQLGADNVFFGISELKNIDGAVIATPTSIHLESVCDVASLGNFPIFVEKPLSQDIDAATEIVQKIGSRLFIMDKWRYHPGILALAKIVKEKILGQVLGLRSYRLGWGNPHPDVDGIWTLAPHDLAIIYEIFGFLPEPHAATATYWQAEATGLTAILGTKLWATMEISTRHYPTRREVRLECEEGVAVLTDGYAEQIEIYRRDSWKFNCDPKIESIKISGDLPLYSELKCFVDYLNGGPSPKSNAQEGLAIISMIDSLREMAGLRENEFVV